jgi:anaerobic selenocysteine-containing dehydrogenase
VVLPASTFAESPDVDADDQQVSAGSLVPPQGDAWPDYRVLRGLAHACGLGTYFPWETFHEAMAARHVPWMEDAALQPHPHPTLAQPRFGTPSGKAEFESALVREAGQPALPEWTPPTEPVTAEFPLRLVTGPRPRARINSQFSQSPSVRARMREPELLVHPEVASAAGVKHGSPVDVVSAHGRVTLRAVVTTDVRVDCVVMPAGWEEANPNRLIGGSRRDPLSGFPAFRSGACRVEPHRG